MVMFRAIKGIFTNPDIESPEAIRAVNSALEGKYTSNIKSSLDNKKTAVFNYKKDERRSDERRNGASDRRALRLRRVRKKFVLINRRKSDGRRLLSKGRRYIENRRLED